MTKELRVAICVPTSGMCRSWFAHSLATMMSSQQLLPTMPDVTSMTTNLFMQETSVIHANREILVKGALEWKATHIMFLDDDMIFEPQVLAIMLGRRHAMVACNYPKRGWPLTFTAIRPDGRGIILTTTESTGLEEAAYTGFGVSLIEAKVFEQTPKPWFLPLYLPEADMYTTEDNPFCERIRKAGFTVYVDHDASKFVGHNGSHTYHWLQWHPPQAEAAAPQLSVVPKEAA